MALDHVHVYKVVGKAEVDFDHSKSISLEQREREALDMAKDGKLQFEESDCNFIALGFHIGGKD